MFGIEWLHNGSVVERETSVVAKTLDQVLARAKARAPQVTRRLRGREPDSFRLTDASGKVIGIYPVENQPD